jgi:DNA-binding GntR family transcriptional regulator
MAAPDQAKPPYQRIADEIRDKITRGELAPGDRLDSIRDLASRYNTSPMTIQRAIALLREAGLVASSQGHGTFITTADDHGDTSVANRLIRIETDLRRVLDEFTQLKHQMLDSGEH